MKAKILGLLAVGLLAGPMAANAIVIYEFNGNRDVRTYSFVYESPDFISTDRTVPVTDLTSCMGPAACVAIRLSPSGFGTPVASDSIQMSFGNSSSFFYFQDGALGAFGSYNSILLTSNTGTLVVRGGTSVPEPGTLALLGLGLLGLGVSRRKKAA